MRRFLPLFPLFLLLAACSQSGPMAYVSLDQQFSEPLLKQWAKEMQLPLRTHFDSEGSKTVGLVTSIKEERKAPRASLYWNNELAHTVALAEEGLLEPYESPAGKDIPAQWKDPEHRWHAFAARARVIVVNTKNLPDPATWPKSYRDLVDPKWKGRCAIARPVTGTTATHLTALRGVLGDAAFDEFVTGMFANDVKFLASNGATLNQTADGAVDWAFTDTDDYHVGKLRGKPVACVFPDQQEGGIGTMLIPNSVALIKGGPDLETAKKFVDRILARETEALLAAAESAQIPLRAGVQGPDDPAIKAYGAFRAMEWDVQWTAQNLARCLADFDKRFRPQDGDATAK